MKATTHHSITILMISTTANATSGIKSATAIADFNMNPMTPHTVVAIVWSCVPCEEIFEKSNNVI